VIYKYIWLDGYTPEQNLRSKIQVAEGYGILSENDGPQSIIFETDGPPIWAFDGSSTQQAEGGLSDCVLKPVSDYKTKTHTLVMCEVLNSDHTPHESNYRTECEAFVGDEWWFGFSRLRKCLLNLECFLYS